MRLFFIILTVSFLFCSDVWGRPALPVSSIPSAAPESVRMALNDLYSDDRDVLGEGLITLREKGPAALSAVPYLISMLDDETDLKVQGLTTVSGEAAAALIAVGAGAQEKLIEGLSSGKAAIRSRCAYVLGELRNPEPAGVMAEMAKNERVVGVRVSVIKALGNIKNRASIVHLLGLLGDPDDAVADATVGAMASFGYPAIKPLSYNLKDPDPKRRANAARALGLIQDPLVINDIVAMTGDPQPRVRKATAEALGSLNMIQAIEPLINMLGDEDAEVKRQAIISLKVYPRNRILEPVIFKLDSFDEQASAEARKIILESDRAMTLPLIRKGLKSGSNVLRSNLLKITLQLGEESLLPDIINLFKTTASADIRHLAIDNMIVFKDSSVIDALGSALSSSDPALSAHALSGLVTLNEITREVADLVETKLRDPDRNIRIMTAAALPHTDSYRLTPVMDESLKSNDTPEVKIYCLESLSKIKYTKSLPNIYPLMNDRSEAVRIAAAKALVAMGDKGSAETFGLYVNDDVAEIRRMCVKGLATVAPDEYKAVFMAKLQDSDAGVREEAATALGLAGDSSALNDLIKVFYDDEEIGPRIAALRSLSDIDTKLTVAFELDGLKARNLELKKAAVECASKYKDKNIYLKLADLLKDSNADIAAAALESLKNAGNKNYESYEDWLKWAVKQK